MTTPAVLGSPGRPAPGDLSAGALFDASARHPVAGLAGYQREELAALVYVSGFQPGDAEHFGPGMVAAFARAARTALTSLELATVCRVLFDPDPAPGVDSARLAACYRAARLLTGGVTQARRGCVTPAETALVGSVTG